MAETKAPQPKEEPRRYPSNRDDSADTLARAKVALDQLSHAVTAAFPASVLLGVSVNVRAYGRNPITSRARLDTDDGELVLTIATR